MLTAVFLLALGAPEATQPKLLVMSLKEEQGASQSVIRLLDELILSEFQKTHRFAVTGQSDLLSLINLETQKQLAGCEDDACLIDMGGALGVDYAVFGSLGMLGEVALLNLKLINLTTGRVDARFSESITGGDAALVGAAQRAVRQLSAQPSAGLAATLETSPAPPPSAEPGGATEPAAHVSPPPAEIARADDSSPVYETWWFWTAIGAVVVGGTVTAIVLAQPEDTANLQVNAEFPIQ